MALSNQYGCFQLLCQPTAGHLYLSLRFVARRSLQLAAKNGRSGSAGSSPAKAIKRKTPVFRSGIHPPDLAATCACGTPAPRSSHSAITEGMITRRRPQSVRACGAVPGIKRKSACHALC